MAFKTIFFICLAVSFVIAKHEEYDGYSLYEIVVQNTEQAHFVHDLENQLHIDVWSPPLPSRPGSILVSKENKQKFQQILEAAEIKFNIQSENIKEQLDREDELLAAGSTKASRADGHLSFDTIHRYDVVDQYLVFLANQYPDIVAVESAGTSFQGRDIKYLKISTTNFQDSSKPIVMMESLLHAREWVTLPATLYAIQQLVSNAAEQQYLQNIDWIIVPIANPDGYEFSHTSNRFWRKNRANDYSTCTGVDLNRNFNFAWGSSSSSVTCSETFHGRQAFSEPEAAAIGSVVREHSDRIKLFLDIHSFGSWMLYGFGNGTLPSNGLFIHLAGVQMAQAIDAVKWPAHPNYVVGNSALLLYSTSGTAQDYAQITGIPLSYTYELPAYANSNGLIGFLVDPSFIEQAGYETWQGIKAGALFALNNYS